MISGEEDNLIVISQQMIQEGLDILGPEKGSNLQKIIKMADEYKNAGLTPLFLLNNENGNVTVTTAEKLKTPNAFNN